VKKDLQSNKIQAGVLSGELVLEVILFLDEIYAINMPLNLYCVIVNKHDIIARTTGFSRRILR